MREILPAAALACQLSSVAYPEETPDLGVPVEDGVLAGLDFTVMPDGAGLPAGSGDATLGVEVYRIHCIGCHGDSGTGGINDELVGGRGSLATEQPKKTIGSYWPHATTLFDYIRRAMPYSSPGTLSNDDIYAVTAYLLYLNGIIEQDTVIDSTRLPAVEMPNRHGFDPSYPPSD